MALHEIGLFVRQYAIGRAQQQREPRVDQIDLRQGDRYLVVNPFFHTFGYKAGWVASLIRGATIYPVPTFDAGVVLESIARNRISVLPGPPTIYQSLLAHPDRERTDLS